MSRTKTPKEIREEFERLAKEKADKRLKELTNTLVNTRIVSQHFSIQNFPSKGRYEYWDQRNKHI